MGSRSSKPTIPREDVDIFRDIGMTIGKHIGSGAYGTVFEAKCVKFTEIKGSRQERVFAVKFIDYYANLIKIQEQSKRNEYMQMVDREKKIMTLIKHKNIVNVVMCLNLGECHDVVVDYDAHQQKFVKRFIFSHIYIIMEMINGGPLYKFLANSGGLSRNRVLDQTMVRNLCRQMAEGIHYLHSQDISHGDIHSGNVLLYNDPNTNEMIPKWSDYGLSSIGINQFHRGKDIRCLAQKCFRPTFEITNFSDGMLDTLSFDLLGKMKQMQNMRDVLAHRFFAG